MSTTTPSDGKENEPWSLEDLKKAIIDSSDDYQRIIDDMKKTDEEPVSYTHLTLPTSDLV